MASSWLFSTFINLTCRVSNSSVRNPTKLPCVICGQDQALHTERHWSFNVPGKKRDCPLTWLSRNEIRNCSAAKGSVSASSGLASGWSKPSQISCFSRFQSSLFINSGHLIHQASERDFKNTCQFTLIFPILTSGERLRKGLRAHCNNALQVTKMRWSLGAAAADQKSH